MSSGVEFSFGDAKEALGVALAPIRQRLEQPGPFLRSAVPIIRDEVREEFQQRAWFAPGGGSNPWPAVVAFGDKPAGRQPLVASGAYFAALQGGAGAIEQVGSDSVAVGASGSRFPYAAVQRGGAGGSIDTSPVIIRPKKLSTGARGGWAMRWALGLGFGVWLREETLLRGLSLPRRPHMTAHPGLYLRLSASMLNYLLTGNAAEA